MNEIILNTLGVILILILLDFNLLISDLRKFINRRGKNWLLKNGIVQIGFYHIMLLLTL